MPAEKHDFYRFPWDGFPDTIIHADENEVREHECYCAAKTGDADAAYELVHSFLNECSIREMERIFQSADGNSITLVSAHALEREGVNAIPEAMAELLGARLNWNVEHQVVQTNIVSHTKADGFSRLAKQAAFEGSIDANQTYFMVDDFIGQGGTLANLRGWIMHCGGLVCGATVLTGKPYSAKITL